MSDPAPLGAFTASLQANEVVYRIAPELRAIVEGATAPERHPMRRVEIDRALAHLDATIHHIIMDEAHEANAVNQEDIDAADR